MQSLTKPFKISALMPIALTLCLSACTAPAPTIVKPQIPANLLVPPPRNLNGSAATYLNRVADSRATGTPDAELVDSLSKGFAGMVNKVAIELEKLRELQELVK